MHDSLTKDWPCVDCITLPICRNKVMINKKAFTIHFNLSCEILINYIKNYGVLSYNVYECYIMNLIKEVFYKSVDSRYCLLSPIMYRKLYDD